MSSGDSDYGGALELPEGVDGYAWRLLVSERVRVTLPELEGYWSLDDMFDAHAVLDVIEAEESKQMAAARSR